MSQVASEAAADVENESKPQPPQTTAVGTLDIK
jgi:hypothetical protein